MQTVANEIDVDVPIREVYDQWTQFEDFPAFMSGVEQIRQLDDATAYWQVSVGGVDRGFTTKISEQKPEERIAWHSIDGPEHAGVVTFHRLNDHETRVRLQLEWEPEGFVERVGAALQVDDAQVSSDLKAFAKLMHENGFATGSWRGSIDRPDQR